MKAYATIWPGSTRVAGTGRVFHTAEQVPTAGWGYFCDRGEIFAGLLHQSDVQSFFSSLARSTSVMAFVIWSEADSAFGDLLLQFAPETFLVRRLQVEFRTEASWRSKFRIAVLAQEHIPRK